MTIKEIESLSGLTRANIRFYETEGFITPARLENGYRDYTEKDLEILKKIKLLRMLHISLEEIKSLQKGEQELSDALDRHLIKLAKDKADLEHSQKICEEIRDDGVAYEALNAQRYLEKMEQKMQEPSYEFAKDTEPRQWIPWRRYFARMLDLILYEAIWSVVLALVFSVSVLNRGMAGTLLDTVVGMIFMVALEPLLLSQFGTTLGKWILGIRITNIDGGKLSYSEALTRTCRVLWTGMGVQLPIYGIWREYKSYQAYSEDEASDWEMDSELVVKDTSNWRIAGLVVAHVVIAAVLWVSDAWSAMPVNRGDITVAEFCENYNRYLDYYDMDVEYTLDSKGAWCKDETEYVIYLGDQIPRPELVFTEENGYMTGLSFEQTLHNSGEWTTAYQDERIFAVMAFALTEAGFDITGGEVQEIIDVIEDKPFENFELSAYGVNVVCNIAYSGYYEAYDWMLMAEEGAETELTVRFSMSK